MVRVSIIIPTHNRAAMLSRALRSALQQTVPPFEVIVVDDASSDETPAVLHALANTNVRYLRHEKPLGGSAARNTGIHAARGEWIAFLDDDDEWVPEKLERQLAVAPGYRAVICSASIRGRSTRLRDHGPEMTREELKQGCVGAGTSGLLVRAEVLRNTSFDESLPRGQDWDLLIRLTDHHRVAYVNEPLVIYNDGQHARITNQVGKQEALDVERQLAVLYKHRRFLGRFWFNYHCARTLLYRVWDREGKIRHLTYAVRRAGAAAVAAFYLNRLYRRLLQVY